MSGVAAVVTWDLQTADPSVLDPLVAAVPHRATGSCERRVDGPAALAQLRRADADAPRTPARDPVTGAVVVADARLDDRSGLQQMLGSGDDAATTSAELLLAAYRRWGLDGLNRLIGDFAFVLWDPRRQLLMLVRDPLAMRGLYYRREARRVLVATEIAQLLAVPGVPNRVNAVMAGGYLAGVHGDPEATFYEGISQVPAGHAVVFERNRVRSWRYWDVDPTYTLRSEGPEGDGARLREVFTAAVRDRSRGQRRPGVLLSGGIDSGAVGAVAGWLAETEGLRRPHTYSWDFGPYLESDERHVSRHINERYGLQGTDVPAYDAGPLAQYPEHPPTPDDPINPAFQAILDRAFTLAADQGVGPLFTGMRGDVDIGRTDEDYPTLLRTRRWRALAGELRRHASVLGAAPAARELAGLAPVAARMVRKRARAILRTRSRNRPLVPGTGPSPVAAAPWINRSFADAIDLPSLVATYSVPPRPPLAGTFRQRRYQRIFGPQHLRWTTAHERRVARWGLEAVDAWSDRRVIELCLALPQQAIGPPDSENKSLARSAFHDVMPASFLRDAGKYYPRPVYLDALRGPAVPAVRELLTDSQAEAAGWLHTDALWESYERFLSGGPPVDNLWYALNLERWLRVSGAAV